MGKVLLVNDSKFESIIIKDILNAMGHDVKISDEDNALDNIKSYCPDFLVVNFIMKRIRGDQLITLAKVENKSIRCILTSSNAINENDIAHKHIDAIIHTPVDKAGMERIFSKIASLGKDELVEELQNSSTVLSVENMSDILSESRRTEDEETHEFDIIRFCPFCGHKLMEKDREPVQFCAFCGQKL